MDLSRTSLHRTVLAVDVEGFGDPRRTHPDQVIVRAGVYGALRVALGRVGIAWAACYHEDRGDGVLVLVPSDMPKTLLGAAFIAELSAELERHNAVNDTAARIRLRLAIHAGEVLVDEHGVVGRSVNLAFRLLDSAPVRSALAGSSGVVAVIVSDWFFQEVTCHDPAQLKFHRSRVSVKETEVDAWVHPAPAEVSPVSTGGLPTGPVVPRQLPPAVSRFVGRGHEFDRLSRLLDESARQTTSVVISAIAGTAGVGKTALAVHWARLAQPRFPDGQLYVNLRGYDVVQTLNPGQVLQGFLRALEVPAAEIPADLDAQTALYRSLVDGRRMLVVLDNARTAEQVRPLLPTGPHCFALVTSRSRLSGLVARDGARRIDLAPLTDADAMTLLREIVGPDRAEAEPAATAALARRCAGLPLALRIAAERVATHPHATMTELADEFAAESTRLDLLAADDESTAVRTAFSWSYHSLKPDSATMFRLLGLHAGPEPGAAAAATLAGTDEARASQLLDALTGVHLLERTESGRYRCHDLLRVYAAERSREEPEHVRRAAVRRLLTWYLHAADAAQRVLLPELPPIELDDGTVDQVPEFENYGEALDWYDAEYGNLLAAVGQAEAGGHHEIAWKLPMALLGFFNLRRAWGDWLQTYDIGLRSARRLGDRLGEAWILASLGHAFRELSRFDEAVAYSRQALDICRAIGFRWGEAAAMYNLGGVYRSLGRFEDSLSCLEQALALFRETGNRQGESRNLTALGNAYREMRDFENAARWHGLALDLYREIGDRQGQGVALDDLGATYAELRRFDAAEACFAGALAVHRATGDRAGEARTLAAVGELHHHAGRHDLAVASLRQALAAVEDEDLAQQLRKRLREWELPGPGIAG